MNTVGELLFGIEPEAETPGGDVTYNLGIEGLMQKGYAGWLNEKDYNFLLQQGFKPEQFEASTAEGGTIKVWRLKELKELQSGK